MKSIFITLLFSFFLSQVFGRQDQVRVEIKNKQKKDSVEQAIINKQATALKITSQIDSLSKAGIKGKVIDSLQSQKSILLTQVSELKKVTPTPEPDEVQSNTLSIATLVFGLILMVLVLIFKGTNDSDYLHTYKLIGIIFIGTVSVFLIPAGFDNTQITPIVGLLGTLAGYLVGSSTQNNNNQKPTAPVSPDK